MCSFSSPGDGAGPCHTAEHPSARRVVCADSGPKPLGPRARRHRASQLRNGRGSRRRATPRVRDPAGLPRTALWADGHRTGRFVASIPCRRARASATSTAATSKPPASRLSHTPQTDSPHGRRGSEGALPRCHAARGWMQREVHLHPPPRDCRDRPLCTERTAVARNQTNRREQPAEAEWGTAHRDCSCCDSACSSIKSTRHQPLAGMKNGHADWHVGACSLSAVIPPGSPQERTELPPCKMKTKKRRQGAVDGRTTSARRQNTRLGWLMGRCKRRQAGDKGSSRKWGHPPTPHHAPNRST